jgi:hypothetical protein
MYLIAAIQLLLLVQEGFLSVKAAHRLLLQNDTSSKEHREKRIFRKKKKTDKIFKENP